MIDGQLHGASNVAFDGDFYDVEFVDGSCIELFNGCDEVADFTFDDPGRAMRAA